MTPKPVGRSWPDMCAEGRAQSVIRALKTPVEAQFRHRLSGKPYPTTVPGSNLWLVQPVGRASA